MVQVWTMVALSADSPTTVPYDEADGQYYEIQISELDPQAVFAVGTVYDYNNQYVVRSNGENDAAFILELSSESIVQAIQFTILYDPD